MRLMSGAVGGLHQPISLRGCLGGGELRHGEACSRTVRLALLRSQFAADGASAFVAAIIATVAAASNVPPRGARSDLVAATVTRVDRRAETAAGVPLVDEGRAARGWSQA
jgi:hypothetical protein